MSCKIYCITDIDGLNYIGSTIQKYVSQRINHHRWRKKNNGNCSSNKLNLDNCFVNILEECDKNIRKEREQYWIDNTNCVNKLNALFDKKQDYIKNKDKRKEWMKNNFDMKKYSSNRQEYYKSWGGDKRWNNNLLAINVNLFFE